MAATRQLLAVLLVSVLAAGALAGQAAGADPAAAPKDAKPTTPTQIIEETIDKVLAILGNPEYKDPDKKLQLRAKVESTILAQMDMPTVADLTLANYRRKFSKAQMKKFQDVFSRLLLTTYIKHLEKYTDEKVVIVKSTNLSESSVRVMTKTITDTGEIPVDFSMLKLGKYWRLYDVHIEGVSLIRNYRSQFREILLKRSADEFLAQLEKKVKENEAGL